MRIVPRMLTLAAAGSILLFSGCATYYERNQAFQEQFIKGDMKKAAEIMEKGKKEAKGKNRLLYLLQSGTVFHRMGQYEKSNSFFERAYMAAEDTRRNYALDALALVTNPMVTPYYGEDFEVVQLHYFKILNSMQLGRPEDALVECRRLNNRLAQLNDKYGTRGNRYKVDAFALNLMGMLFESQGELNDAFISYRNAYEAYEGNYRNNFGIPAPLQLKKDLLRTAAANGFGDELKRYEGLFRMKHDPAASGGDEIVVFWNNGLGPVKSEWSLNFFIVRSKGGMVTFVNEELGLSFPFPSANGNNAPVNLGDLKFVRIAFPRYLERKPYFREADITVGKTKYPLEPAQDINRIAFSSLEDRMVRECAHSLLRLALKQAAEHEVRKKNQYLGALLSAANALSEKADTRNWQTLPYGIAYARIPLPAGMHRIPMTLHSPRNSIIREDVIVAGPVTGHLGFAVHHTLATLPVTMR